MSSPMEEGSSVFFTPLKNVHFFEPTSARQSPFVDADPILLSPQKSVRGIILSDRAASPSRLLSGRGGLRSPEKRDIEKSARKRLIKNSNFYKRLLDAGTSDGEDDEEDRKFAEKLLQISRGNSDRAYASDVDLEQDLTEVPTRQKRRYTRRKGKSASLTIEFGNKSADKQNPSINGSCSLGNNNQVKGVEGRPRKNAYNRDRISLGPDGTESDQSSARIEASSEITKEKYSDNEQNDPNHPDTHPIRELKRGRPRRITSYADESDDESDDDSEDNVPKRKRGRPSKQEGVIGSIKSIFDEDAFEFEKSPEKTVKVETKKTPNSKHSLQVSLFESTLLNAPIISGIPNGELKIEPLDPKIEFVSLPVPELTEDGELTQEYLLKYFEGKQLASANGRFLDERSFFLEGTEGYFEQNSLKTRPSGNSLAEMAPTLDHAEFAHYLKLGSKLCAHSSSKLLASHTLLYRQLCFELSQGFNVCFHGLGSKIQCIQKFVENYIPRWIESVSRKPETPIVMVINGFNPHLKLKDTFFDLAKAVARKDRQFRNVKIPRHVSEMLSFIIKCLRVLGDSTQSGVCLPRLILAVNNLDGEMLRDDKIQELLSELCSMPQVWLIASVDHVNVSLLWDLDKSRRYNFAWHNLTTLRPYRWELASKDMINMGRSKMFVGEKGARYVLMSLPINSRKIYHQLLENQILGIQKTITAKANINSQRGTLKNGIELTRLYDTCMDAFLTSSEMLFRTVLGEFIEHGMCNLAKDASGVEVVYIPFNYDEMQKLVQEDI